MAEEDYSVKKLLRDSVRFADLYNGTVFHGNQVLRPEDLSDVPDENGIAIVGLDGKRRLIRRSRDVIKKASFGAYFVLLAEENQDKVHYAMPVRSMLYDALEYTEQVEALKRRHRERGDVLDGDAFLSGIAGDDRLMPVVTLTVYHGQKPWDGPRSLYDMLEMDRDSKAWEALKEVLPDYRLNLVELNNMQHLERFRSSLQPIFTVLQYNRKDKRKFYEYLESHREELRQMDDDSVRAMLALLGEQKRLLKMLELPGDEGKERMDVYNAIDELIADGREEGKELGLKLGQEMGLEMGLERGRELGLELGQKRVNELTLLLINAGRTEDLIRAARDRQYQEKLFEEFGI